MNLPLVDIANIAAIRFISMSNCNEVGDEFLRIKPHVDQLMDRNPFDPDLVGVRI
jgi:hypothetical protein